MARLRVGGAVASTPVAPRFRVGGVVASGPAIPPRLRVGGVVASGPAIPPRLRVGGVVASGEPAPTGTFRRVHGGTWQPGWFMPGQVMRRVHPDTTWHPVSSTPAPSVPTPVLGRLRVGGAVASGPALVPSTGLPAHVIVGAIQSNVRGAATDWDQSDQFNNPLIEMYRWSDGQIVPATEPLSTRDTATGMGALNTFVKSYAADHPGQRVIVLNTARGGTGLTTPSTNPAGTAFTWDPNAVNDANNLARTSVATINSLMSTLPAGSKIVAYIANHGSTDGVNLGNTSTTKDTFKSLFTRWLNYLRTQTNTANVPYLMLQMRPSLLAEARHNLIDQAQQEIAAVTPGVEHVPSPVGSEYAMPDSVHFNARGVREIGNRLYQRFSSAQNPVKIALIGDSTLAGIGETAMRNALVAEGFSASNIWFYARTGKPIILNDDLGKNALVNMAEARAAIGEPDIWVFNLGSNGHRDSRNPEWIGQVLANAGSADVLWSGITQVNGYTDGNLSSEATRLAWNDVARPLVQAHPGGQWLDWHAYAKSYPGGDAGWWNSDGVHHTTTGTARKLEFLVDQITSEASPVDPTPTVLYAGALPLGQASYTPTGDTRYLATNGSNSNAGTLAAPWATLQHAINNTPTNGTIVVRGGIHYTGSNTTPNGKVLRIINAPGEAVWFDGTVVVNGWTSNGNGTWTAPYAYTLLRANVETSYKGTNPMRNHPDQLWLDSMAMVQVPDNTVPGAGQFSVNQATDTITVGTSPVGKTARVVAHKQFLVAAGRTDLLGIGIRRYSPETMEYLNAMVYVAGSSDGAIIENCWFSESHLGALHITRPNMRISKNTIENCGQTGLHAYQAHNLVFENNHIHHINRLSWQPEPTTAGAKLTMANNVIMRNNLVHNVNGAYGLWFDVSMNRFRIYGNYVYGGGEVMKHGIEVELSGGGFFNGTQHKSYIVGNRAQNCRVGILVFDSSDVIVANNDVRGCELGVHIWQDSRMNEGPLHGQTYTFAELPWIARNNETLNNVYQPGGGYNIQMAAFDDGGRHNLRGLDMVTRIDGEWYYTTPPGSMVQLGQVGGTRSSYNSPAALATAGAAVGGPIGSKLGNVYQSSSFPTDAQRSSQGAILSAPVAQMLGLVAGARWIGTAPGGIPVPR